MKINHTYLQSPFEIPDSLTNSALLERYTTFPNTEYEKFWYTVLRKSNFKQIDNYKSYVRRNLRAGLRRNKIQVLKKSEISDFLFLRIYECISSVFKKYEKKGNKYYYSKKNLKIFIQNADFIFLAKDSNSLEVSGIIFAKKVKNGIFLSESFFNQRNSKGIRNYVSYALLYSVIEYFMNKEVIEFITNGTINLEHITNIHDFLIKDFDFEKVYVDLHIRVSIFILLLFFLIKLLPILRIPKFVNTRYLAFKRLLIYRKSITIKFI